MQYVFLSSSVCFLWDNLRSSSLGHSGYIFSMTDVLCHSPMMQVSTILLFRDSI